MHRVLLLICLLVVACSTHYQSLNRRDSTGNATIYDADPSSFLSAAFDAISRQFPSSEIRELRGYERGFVWSHMPLLDRTNYRFTIKKVLGETPKGDKIVGIAYSVVTSGTQGLVETRYIVPLVEELDRVLGERGIRALNVVNARPAQASTVATGDTGTTTGTGFFISADGYLLTSQHVIEGAKQVFIQVGGAKTVASVVRVDRANDFALLKVDQESRPLSLGDASRLRRADTVLTLGYPLHGLQGQEQKATFGRVNALSGVRDDIRYLQIDVAIQPGNSGGPLLNEDGEVIGVVAGTLDELNILRATGALPQSVNYAMKIDYAIPLLQGGISTRKRVPQSQPMRLSDVVQEAEKSVVMVIADR